MTKEIKKENLHLIYTPFTGVGLHGGFRGNKWLEHRINIFKNYTLKSLLNQSNRNFIHWLSFRPEEFNNLFVKDLAQYLKEKQYNFIFTFDGLMYWDDKFSKDPISRIKNIARVGRKCWRTKDFSSFISGIKQTLKDKNGTLEKRLESSLGNLRQHFYDADYIYVTRIDSDDMFKNTVIEMVQSIPPKSEALIFRNGLVYNKDTKDLAEWNPKTNPPFHTIIFPRDTFFDSKKYLQFYGNWKSHEDTPKVFTYSRLPDWNYCVLVHSVGNQISTCWTHSFKGKLIQKEEAKEILKSFGIYDND